MDRLHGGELELARLRIRLLALVYELVLLAALLLCATAMFVLVVGDARVQPLRMLLQLFLLIVAGGYFVWNWTGDRRTLPMRTWRIRVVDSNGQPLNAQRAAIRYLVAVACYAAGGLALLWALVDRDRQFLHDRIAGTRLTIARR